MKQIPYEDRTDSVQAKLRLLETALAAGNLELAMSVCESAKDTLAWQRQQADGPAPDVPADHFVAVDSLPKAWAAWARGWKFCKPISVFETIGIERSGEPVDLVLAFPFHETTDLGREVRVARVDPATGALGEIPCQVYAETRRGPQRRCRLVLAADVAAHRQTTYLVFYGNPLAERPDYATDLAVRGEGYALDIENHHFTARLSRQVGQLERLTYKRQHGLELYAGGKGHGEPPGIDWAHDYVDAGHFQKLRMRNAPALAQL